MLTKFVFARIAVVPLIVSLTVLASGCNSSEKPDEKTPVAEKPERDASHGGWWCVEHGVPEEECSMCSAKVAEACKADGDWCEEHNRADSQCFICHPELIETFAEIYKKKFNEAPPKPELE